MKNDQLSRDQEVRQLQSHPQLRVLHREHQRELPVPDGALRFMGQVPRGWLLRLHESILSQVRAGRATRQLPRVRLPDDWLHQAVLQLVAVHSSPTIFFSCSTRTMPSSTNFHFRGSLQDRHQRLEDEREPRSRRRGWNFRGQGHRAERQEVGEDAAELSVDVLRARQHPRRGAAWRRGRQAGSGGDLVGVSRLGFQSAHVEAFAHASRLRRLADNREFGGRSRVRTRRSICGCDQFRSITSSSLSPCPEV